MTRRPPARGSLGYLGAVLAAVSFFPAVHVLCVVIDALAH